VWRELYPGPPPPVPDTKRIPAWVLMVMNAALIVATLAALVGIWFGQPRG
jgi:putative membrane protein